MTSVWHTVIHGGAAAILLAIGIPLLVLSARASRGRPRRIAIRPAGDVRPALFAAITIMAMGGLTLSVLSAARTSDLLVAAIVSTLAAAMGAVAMHAVRRASFNSVVTVPLAGIVAIGMLVAIAGPNAPTAQAHGGGAHGGGAEITHTH